MRWDYIKEKEKDWHNWFAWFPVTAQVKVKNKFVLKRIWLEFVERKLYYEYGKFTWVYRKKWKN